MPCDAMDTASWWAVENKNSRCIDECYVKVLVVVITVFPRQVTYRVTDQAGAWTADKQMALRLYPFQIICMCVLFYILSEIHAS